MYLASVRNADGWLTAHLRARHSDD